MMRSLLFFFLAVSALMADVTQEEKYVVVQAALRTHMPEIALAELNKIEPQERDRAYWLHKGHTLRQLKRPLEAVEAFSEAIKTAPENATGYAGIGMAYTDSGDFSHGEQNLEKAIELAPMEASFHHDLAKLYLMQRHYRQARQPLSIALRLGGGKEVVKHLAIAMTLSGDEAKAKALLMERYDLHELYCLLGEAYELGDRIPEAVARYQMALRVQSHYHKAQQRLKRLIGESL